MPKKANKENPITIDLTDENSQKGAGDSDAMTPK